MSKTSTAGEIVLALTNFEAHHGSVVTNALEQYATAMREHAAEAQAGSGAEPVPASSEPGTISLAPTPAGWRRIAGMFTEAADRADKARRAYEQLAGRAEDTAETL